jgi:protein-disulfide isomerase
MKQNTVPGKINDMTVIADPGDLSPYLNGEKKTIVLFEMTACPYCRMFEERFLDFADARSGDYVFLRVTIDDPGNPLWSRYDIQAVPTVIVFANNKIMSRLDSVLFVGITKKNWAEFCASL